MRKTIPPLSKLRVYGQKATDEQLTREQPGNYFQLKEVYTLSTQRSSAEEQIISLTGNESIEMVFEDDTIWFGDRATILEVFPELDTKGRAVSDIPELPLYLEAAEDSRGLFGKIAIKILRIFAKKALTRGVAKIAEDFEKKLLEGRSGLYALDASFNFSPDKKIDTKTSTVLLLHGTAASTEKSFKDLKDSSLWKEMCDRFPDNLFCFEHETLTKGPFQNTLELLQQIPDGTKLQIISTSRGGLVGELLIRFSENPEGFPEAVKELFSKQGRKTDVEMMTAISIVMAKKKIVIERFIRIACPARGTTLLSKRVDIFLNVLLNLLTVVSGAAAPLMEVIKALIGAVLDGKNSPDILPGLEVQNPESLFMKALNSPNCKGGNVEGFNNPLLVVAGNGKASLSLKGLAVLLLKLVYKGADNDMVVDTESMYQGARRKDPVQFFLDEGAEVNHFSYFKNKKTNDAIRAALFTPGSKIPTFKERPVINIQEAERGIFGLEGGSLYPEKVSGVKPIIILLPGIMGSVLEQNKEHIWINYLRFVGGGLSRIHINSKNVEATALIKTAYNKLFKFLSADYDVVVFPFDWRLSVSEAGSRLNDKINELTKHKKPIRIIAHSMGGIVVRDLMINHSDTWKMLNSQDNFTFLMLGTPWMGSYRIPYVLAGLDSMIKQINNIDFSHSKGELVDMFSKYPGLLNLLPVRKNDIDFSRRSEWESLQQASGLNWLLPDEVLLKGFKQFKSQVNDSIDGFDYSKIVYVAGKDKITQSGYTIENGELKFLNTEEGDQSVTWESGIPAKLNREKSLYYVNASHGSLVNREMLFKGIKEIMDAGKTEDVEFKKQPVPVEERKRSFADTEQFEFESNDKSIESSLLGFERETITAEPPASILKISVSSGDLMHSSYPVLIGHFAKDGILYAESVADRYLESAMTLKHSLSIYPDKIGTSDVFLSKKQNHFKGCIIAGLGQAEYLNANQLLLTIEKSVVNYLLTYCKDEVERSIKNNKQASKNQRKKIGLSSLLIGAGYGGLSLESSCRAIMQGISNANTKVTALTGIDDLYVDHLEFVELFEDKAIQCFLSINKLMYGNNDSLNIAWKEQKIKQLLGFRKRLLGDPSSDWWQRLSVLCKNRDKKEERKVLSYYSSTNTAREEQQDLYNNLELIESMLEDISIKRDWSFEKARAIFELLIPNDFKENIRRNAPVLWVLDEFTASFPWELLQTGSVNDKPLCIGAGMIRQLAITEYDTVSSPVKTNNVLIVGDPNLNGFTKAKQLEGAKKEGESVYQKLQQYDLTIESPLIQRDSDEIITALFKQDYKIVHLAGHGIFNPYNPYESGMVIGKKKNKDEPLLLTPFEFAKLPSPPEFMFINCCHLGRINPFAEELSANRFKLAANIGTQLIKNGVKAVIVAGWEVHDSASLEFANLFYERMFEFNDSFGDAVKAARERIYNRYRYSNTWGAFQCYGDPHYKFDITKSKKENKDSKPRVEKLAQQIENELDAIISKSEITFYDQAALYKDLLSVSGDIKNCKYVTPEIIEKEATAYVEFSEYKIAMNIFNKLFALDKANYDVKSLERYQNIYSKQMLKEFLSKEKSPKECIKGIDKSVNNLNKLVQIAETPRRFILIGSAYKRKAFIIKDKKERIKELEKAAYYYQRAWKLGGETGLYAYSNWVTLEAVIFHMHGKKWVKKTTSKKYEVPTLNTVKKTMLDLIQNESSQDPDYWDMTDTANAELCLLILTGDSDTEAVSNSFSEVWRKAGSQNKRNIQLESLDLLIEFFNVPDAKKIQNKIKMVRERIQVAM